MSLFRKKENKTKSCCCGSVHNADNRAKTEIDHSDSFSVKVLGSGCKKCNELEYNAKVALQQLGMDTTIDHVTDFTQIAGYGVMSTPALVVNGKVVSVGKVLETEKIAEILKNLKG